MNDFAVFIGRTMAFLTSELGILTTVCVLSLSYAFWFRRRRLNDQVSPEDRAIEQEMIAHRKIAWPDAIAAFKGRPKEGSVLVPAFILEELMRDADKWRQYQEGQKIEADKTVKEDKTDRA